MTKVWKVEEAKAHFSDVIRQAEAGEAQLITRRGKAAAVVLSADEYQHSQRSGWDVFKLAPKVDEFEPVRLPGLGREIDPL